MLFQIFSIIFENVNFNHSVFSLIIAFGYNDVSLLIPGTDKRKLVWNTTKKV